MWSCCVKEFMHSKFFNTFYKIGGISLELISRVWKYPFSQIFVKLGNFCFKIMPAKVVDESGALLFFLSQFLWLLVRLACFLIRCHDGEAAEWLPPSFKTKSRNTHKQLGEGAVLSWCWRDAALTWDEAARRSSRGILRIVGVHPLLLLHPYLRTEKCLMTSTLKSEIRAEYKELRETSGDWPTQASTPKRLVKCLYNYNI